MAPSERAPSICSGTSTPNIGRWGSTGRPRPSFGSRPSGRCSGAGPAPRDNLAAFDLEPGLRDQYARLPRLPHRVREPVLLDPRADLEIPVGVEELRGHRDQLRDLALVVLELKDLRVALEIIEIVDRAHRELTLQVAAHDCDLRLVERWVVEELPPLGRELAVVR